MDPNGDSHVGLIKIAANEGQQSAKYNQTCKAVLNESMERNLEKLAKAKGTIRYLHTSP